MSRSDKWCAIEPRGEGLGGGVRGQGGAQGAKGASNTLSAANAGQRRHIIALGHIALLEATVSSPHRQRRPIPEYRDLARCRRRKTCWSWTAPSVSTMSVWDEGRIFLLGLPRASGRCAGRPGGRAWCQSLPVLSVSTGGTGRVGRNVGGDARTFCV